MDHTLESILWVPLSRDGHEVELYGFPGLRAPEEPISHNPLCPQAILSDEIIVTCSDGELRWTFNVTEELESSTTIRSATLRKTLFKANATRHDLVCSGLSLSETDDRLRDHFELEPDDFNDMSPDSIQVDEFGVVHVLEVGTTRADPRAEVDLASKLWKYKLPLSNRTKTDMVVCFSVVIVTPTRVVSNIPLPTSVCVDLVTRMRLGCLLEDEAAKLGYDFSSLDTETTLRKMMSLIELQINSVEVKPSKIPSPLTMQPEDITLLSQDVEAPVPLEPFLQSLRETLKPCVRGDLESLKETLSSQERRTDLKPISIFPCRVVRPKTKPGHMVATPQQFHWEGHEALCAAWEAASTCVQVGEAQESENLEDLLRKAWAEEQIRDENAEEGKRSYHRVKLRKYLSTSELEGLAMDGIWAKRYRSENWKKNREKDQSRAFHYDTYTGDIEAFSNNTKIFENCEFEANKPTSHILSLLESAEELALPGISGTQPLEVVKSWSKTNLWNWLDWVSDVAMEVAVSKKQHCVGGEMILKTLRWYECQLLICPTKSSEHTFFSIQFLEGREKQQMAGLPWRTVRHHGTGATTDFISLKNSKLLNLVTAPAFLISMVSFWSWFYGLDDCSPESFTKHGEAARMLLWSLMIRLEDKAATEATITLSRYAYMECFKQGFKNNYVYNNSSVMKILTKVDVMPRSRLNLCLIKKLMLWCDRLDRCPPSRLPVEQDEDQDPYTSPAKDRWEGLLNLFTGGTVKTATQAVNLMYLGYFKNKEESAEGNTDWLLLEKSLEEEFSFDHNQVKLSKGTEEPTTKPKPKQFSRRLIRHGARQLVHILKRKLGHSWQSIVTTEVKRELARCITHEISTLKASANIKHTVERVKGAIKKDPADHRIRVIEAIASKLKIFGRNPMLRIKDFIEHIEQTSQGVIADLFKKQQHAGLREIYVLTIESRVVQLFIETCARVINSFFENETLTHPKNKLSKLEEHKSKASRMAYQRSCCYVDYFNSSDKTRWNQNFVMPAMAIPLLVILPKEYHGCIQRILNLWSNKQLKLPQRVVNLLMSNVELSSATYQELMKRFWSGNVEATTMMRTCFIQCENFVHLCTGMMQGILHFLSSLLHLCFLASSLQVYCAVFRARFPQMEILATGVCSSDDSCTAISIFSPKGEDSLSDETKKAFKLGSLICHALDELAPYYCMKNSVKSTTSAVDYLEYNSEFYFRNTLATPVIKFVAASLCLSESESFINRFHCQYNLMSNCVENGLPHWNASLCQLAQGIVHYKALGSSVNPLFENWVPYIKEYPDPSLGFFLVDPVLLCGVMGYSFSRWLAFKRTPVLMPHSRAFNKGLGEVTITEEGGICESMILKHGNLRRWKMLLKSIIPEDDWKERIEENPELLYRHPEDESEVLMKLALKACMPGVAKSLSRGDPFLQAIASSVYSINTPCFTKTTLCAELTGGTNKKKLESEKVTLLAELRRRWEWANNDEHDALCQEVELVLFPLAQRYKEVEKLLVRAARSVEMRVVEPRQRKTTIYLQPTLAQCPVNLLSVCRRLWFGTNIKASERVYRRCLDAYRLVLPWLSDSIGESLEKSPFSTHPEMFGFISSEGKHVRIFHKLGPGVNTTRPMQQIKAMIDICYKKGVKLIRLAAGSGLRHRRASYNEESMLSELSLALLIPCKRAREDMVFSILESHPLYENTQEIQHMPLKQMVASYAREASLNEDFRERLGSVLLAHRKGLLITFPTPQEPVRSGDKVRWAGRGTALVSADGVCFELNLMDDCLISMKTGNLDFLRMNSHLVVQACEDLGIHCYGGPRSLDSLMCSAKFNGSEFLHPSGKGTPVMVDRSFQVSLNEPRNIKIDIGFGTLSLIHMVSGRHLTIMKFRSTDRDLDSQPRSGECDNEWQAWVHQQALSFKSVSRFLASIEKKRGTDSNWDHIASWAKESLRAKLSWNRHGGLDKLVNVAVSESSMLADEPAEELCAEAMEMFLEEFNLDLGEEDFSEAREGTSTWNELVTMEWDINTVDDAFAVALHTHTDGSNISACEVVGRRQESIFAMHPFWDQLIWKVRDYMGPYAWDSILDGVVIAGQPTTCRLIQSLLGIEEKRVERDLMAEFLES